MLLIHINTGSSWRQWGPVGTRRSVFSASQLHQQHKPGREKHLWNTIIWISIFCESDAVWISHPFKARCTNPQSRETWAGTSCPSQLSLSLYILQRDNRFEKYLCKTWVVRNLIILAYYQDRKKKSLHSEPNVTCREIGGTLRSQSPKSCIWRGQAWNIVWGTKRTIRGRKCVRSNDACPRISILPSCSGWRLRKGHMLETLRDV